MKNQPNGPLTFRSIAEAHSACGLPKPQHPLVSLIDTVTTPVEPLAKGTVHVSSFYKLAYRVDGGSTFHYGQGQYGFAEGSLLFAAPNQLLGCEENTTWRGYMLCLHPDFLLGYPLARTIKQYNFFSYSANEALRLADTEHATITSLFQLMESEVCRPPDDFSPDVFVAQVELLLAYADRFYKRQFITHRTVNRALHQQIDDILDHYFAAHHALEQGLPTVNYLAAQVHVTPSYLSDMLRALTGLSAQQHIHQKLIEKAKEQLSITQRSVSEIAHTLGFEHAQSFSKLFKAKTATSPLAFRRSFRSRE